MIGQADAGAIAGGIPAHALDHVAALTEQNAQLPLVAVGGEWFAPVLGKSLDIGCQLPVLRDERRLVGLE